MSKKLPKDITSYDLLKAVAIISMIIDHIGFYFSPQWLWLRVIGRFSAPIWFFLIGYAETREVQRGIWIGGAIVALIWIMAGQYILPLNILFTLAISRILIDTVMKRALQSYNMFWAITLVLFLLSVPSLLFMEYGTLGLMFAMLGFICRHRQEVVFMDRGVFPLFVGIVALSYSFVQSLLLGPINGAQTLAIFAGVGVLSGILVLFRSAAFPALTKKAGRRRTALIQILGRRTLEIYVLQMAVLAGLAMILFPARFALFQPHWAPAMLLRFFL